MNECTYDLRAFYANEFELIDGERMVFRWGGHVTNILKYKVPETTSIGTTQKFEILIEPEVDYKFIEVFLSHGKSLTFHQMIYALLLVDSKYSVIEDRPARHITDSGLSVLLTSEDTRWCVDCYVYLIVNMIEDKRIYVTSEATSANKVLI